MLNSNHARLLVLQTADAFIPGASRPYMDVAGFLLVDGLHAHLVWAGEYEAGCWHTVLN